jgi:hypothetical protein
MATFPMRRQGNVLKIHLFTAIAIAAYVPADVLEGVETKKAFLLYSPTDGILRQVPLEKK